MELKIENVQLPEQITFNYEELKQELVAKAAHYESLVYSDDQIKLAKADKANLNKLKKALNDERIRREREYMQPFNDFKAKINEIISIIDKPVAVIDAQVKSFEEKQRQDKLDAITEYFNTTEHPEWLHIAQIMNDKWLNASVSMKSIQEEINAKSEQIKTDLATLENLPEYSFEAQQVYKVSLDLGRAVNEAHRMSEVAKKKAEYEAEQARLKAEAEFAQHMNPPVEEQVAGQVEFTDAKSFEENVVKSVQQKQAEQIAEQTGEAVFNNAPDVYAQIPVVEKQWIAFQALMTVEQAKELKEFFDSRKIEFKPV